MKLTTQLHGQHYTFRSLKHALNCASEEKSGDRAAGLAAESTSQRIAAKRVIADLELRHFYEQPSVPYEVDEITRLIVDDLDQRAYKKIQGWTAGQLREWLLDRRTSAEDIAAISKGVTPEMAAAVA
jgi:ethanolamine ammonia-lyase large subunit